MSAHSKPKPWRLKPKDFIKNDVYAKQDWRFQMFFEYLRISPSYALAIGSKSPEDLQQLIQDPVRTNDIWKTKTDVGNVFKTLYRDWWIEKGLELFGYHQSTPKIQVIARLDSKDSVQMTHDFLTGYDQFLNGAYAEQGKLDNLIVAIPLNMNSTTTIKQLNKLISQAKKHKAPELPIARYPLENNKLQYRRLLAGLRLMYIKAAKPDEELWRIAARAEISHSHKSIKPDEAKKNIQNAEGRKMLTIMASRMIHDTLVIAENAATGVFPSTKPISIDLFDPIALQKHLKHMTRWEKKRELELLNNQSIEPSQKTGWHIRNS